MGKAEHKEQLYDLAKELNAVFKYQASPLGKAIPPPESEFQKSKEFAALTGLSRSAISEKLRKGVKAGIVEANGRTYRYSDYVTAAAQRMIDAQPILDFHGIDANLRNFLLETTNPKSWAILTALKSGPLSVVELTRIANLQLQKKLSQPATSMRLSSMAKMGLLKMKRDGPNSLYSLEDWSIFDELRSSIG